MLVLSLKTTYNVILHSILKPETEPSMPIHLVTIVKQTNDKKKVKQLIRNESDIKQSEFSSS